MFMKMYEFIEARKTDILRNCLLTLRETRPGQTDEELLNDLGHFIDGFVGVLRRDARAGKAETLLESGVRKSAQAAEAAERGLVRKRQGSEITRVIHDYGVLCDKLNELAASESLSFPSRDHQLMNVFLDEAMAKGVEAFTVATATEQREERAEALGSLAHEIRNAVNAATLAFGLIRRGQVASNGSTANVVQRALARIEALVQNALVEAKLQGKIPIRIEDMRLTEVLGQLAEGAFPERGVQVGIRVEPDLHVQADPRLLTSAIGNLLQNAVKFTRDGEQVTLRAKRAGDATIIEVEDRCGGLPRGKVETLFKPFVQGVPDARGVGLGLHIARSAVEAHGGALSVKDLPGVGCVFTISLPRAASETRRGSASAA
jgi:signal transduction histidine kinase